MVRKTGFLRTALWLLFAIDLLSTPTFFLPLSKNLGGVLSPVQAYASAMGGVLMIGWTILLAWAAMKPIERSAVPLVAGLVLVGIMLLELAGIISRKVPPNVEQIILGFLALQVILLVLLVGGLWQSGILRRKEPERQEPEKTP